MKVVKSYFILVWEVWALLVAGYIWVVGVNLLSSDPVFQAASGSVLVGFAVIAQLIFDNMIWRKQFEDPDIESVVVNPAGAINLKLKDGCVGGSFSFVVGEYRPSLAERYSNLTGLGQSRIKHLLHVGISDTDLNGWCDFRRTKARVEYWVTYYIAVSVLLGTLVWGYGLNMLVALMVVLSYFIAMIFAPLRSRGSNKKM